MVHLIIDFLYLLNYIFSNIIHRYYYKLLQISLQEENGDSFGKSLIGIFGIRLK